MHGNVGCGAERTVRMVRGAVRMGVRHLHRAQHSHQQDTEDREENSPRPTRAVSAVPGTHISRLYRRVQPSCLRQVRRQAATALPAAQA
jgi:hypothetical protein